jgi:hypothetical protein
MFDAPRSRPPDPAADVQPAPSPPLDGTAPTATEQELVAAPRGGGEQHLFVLSSAFTPLPWPVLSIP